MTLTLDNQLELHRMMMLIRLFEEALEEMFSRGLLHGTMHLSIGQEASAAGAEEWAPCHDGYGSLHERALAARLSALHPWTLLNRQTHLNDVLFVPKDRKPLVLYQ